MKIRTIFLPQRTGQMEKEEGGKVGEEGGGKLVGIQGFDLEKRWVKRVVGKKGREEWQSIDFCMGERVGNERYFGEQFGALFIQMIQLIIKLVSMKKEEKSTPRANKTRSIYRYELQATNQILKDTTDLYNCSLHSTAQTNREEKLLEDYFDPLIFEEKHQELKIQTLPYRPSLPSLNLHQPSNQSHKSNQIKQCFQTFSDKKDYIKKEISKKKTEEKSKKHIQDFEEYYHSSESDSPHEQIPQNSNKKAIRVINKSSTPNYKRENNNDSKKQLKRQRRGLASISLKVKNIVAKKMKMTFKQVSDQVLKETEDDLPNEPEQREKQTKNIRRRVYDALNVLVSVGILKKDQNKNVVHTQMTNIPGKKLSEHWQVITEKHRIYDEQEEHYNKKKNNLLLLKHKYDLIMSLHERNKKLQEEEQKIQQQSHIKSVSVDNEQKANNISKFHFPLIFIIPPSGQSKKMKVQLENDEKQPENVKKIIVEGNEYVVTDIDMLKYINLNQNIKKQNHFQFDQHFYLQKPTFRKTPLSLQKSLPQQKNNDKFRDNFDDIYLSD